MMKHGNLVDNGAASAIALAQKNRMTRISLRVKGGQNLNKKSSQGSSNKVVPWQNEFGAIDEEEDPMQPKEPPRLSHNYIDKYMSQQGVAGNEEVLNKKELSPDFDFGKNEMIHPPDKNKSFEKELEPKIVLRRKSSSSFKRVDEDAELDDAAESDEGADIDKDADIDDEERKMLEEEQINPTDHILTISDRKEKIKKYNTGTGASNNFKM